MRRLLAVIGLVMATAAGPALARTRNAKAPVAQTMRHDAYALAPGSSGAEASGTPLAIQPDQRTPASSGPSVDFWVDRPQPEMRSTLGRVRC